MARQVSRPLLTALAVVAVLGTVGGIAGAYLRATSGPDDGTPLAAAATGAGAGAAQPGPPSPGPHGSTPAGVTAVGADPASAPSVDDGTVTDADGDGRLGDGDVLTLHLDGPLVPDALCGRWAATPREGLSVTVALTPSAATRLRAGVTLVPGDGTCPRVGATPGLDLGGAVTATELPPVPTTYRGSRLSLDRNGTTVTLLLGTPTSAASTT